MVATKDIVVAAAAGAIYTVTAVASIFFSVPGFIYLYFPTIWFFTLPIWFGLPGLVGIFIGDFIQAGLVKGLGALGLLNALPSAIFPFIYWVLVPAGYGEMKSKKNIVVAVLANILGQAAIVGGIFAYLVVFGILPSQIVWGLFWLTMAFNWPWSSILTIFLLRGLTPSLRKAGVYYGPFRERRLARQVKASEQVPEAK